MQQFWRLCERASFSDFAR